MKITKFLFTIILLHFSTLLFCQERLLLNYEVFNNVDRTDTIHFNLYIDREGDRSLFIQTNVDSTNEKVVKQLSATKFQVSYKYTTPLFNYSIFGVDTLISIERQRQDSYLVCESLSNISWELENIEKFIDSVRVQKASGTFRGRKYIAWFSPEYPVNAGPWKLHGLPGLVFEAYDESKKFNWFLKKISHKYFSDEVFDVLDKNLLRISLKEYIENQERDRDNQIQKVMSKLPQGATLGKVKPARNGRELKFEWEEQ